MARLGMVIDLKRCIGCNACTLACKQENGTPEGIHFARVVTQEVGTYPQTKRTFLPTLCNHCSDAPCATACPTGATYIRPDGIVMVRPQLVHRMPRLQRSMSLHEPPFHRARTAQAWIQH